MISSFREHKASLITLLGVLAVFLVLAFLPGKKLVTLEGLPEFPLEVSESINITGVLVNDQVLPKLLFKMNIDGIGQLKVGSEIFGIGRNSKYCKKVADKQYFDCSIITKIYADETNFELSLAANTTVNQFDWKVVKYKHKTTLSHIAADDNATIALVSGIVFLLVFVFIFQSRQTLMHWGVIVVTMLFLMWNDLYFGLILFAFLFLMHHFNRILAQENNRLPKLVSFIFLSIGFLLLFKYGKEGIYSVFLNPGQFNLFMPLGISYFIIRLIDTQLRWYRGQNLEITFREYLFFIIFPGTLVAGPIENIKDFYKNRVTKLTQSDYASGIGRIIIGAFKKIIIADAFLYKLLTGAKFNFILFNDDVNNLVNSLIVDPTGASGTQIYLFAMIGVLFAYVDFSSYSDMAIGFSRLLGFRIRENFNFPILAINIREYWKRWHMSLSEWAFQNIFFPLMLKTRNSHIPVLVTMLTIGLWHAFNLSWFSWALHHSAGIVAIALMQKHFKPNKRVLYFLTPIRILLTMSFASMGFIFVYFNDYEIASTLYFSLWKSIFPF